MEEREERVEREKKEEREGRREGGEGVEEGGRGGSVQESKRGGPLKGWRRTTVWNIENNDPQIGAYVRQAEKAGKGWTERERGREGEREGRVDREREQGHFNASRSCTVSGSIDHMI
jgi:hypothetical protein